MATPVKFHQKNGLTVYAFACGYIQSAKFTDAQGVELDVTLSHTGGNCYVIKAYEFGGRGNLHHIVTESIGLARQLWAQWVGECHGARIKAAKSDKRYSVASEFCGEREALYVARFEGEWLGKSNTAAGAWLLAARDIQQRQELLTRTVDNEIKSHMAKAFFANAYAEQADECGQPLSGEIMEQTPAEIDSAAIHAADTLARDLCNANGAKSLENVFNRVAVIQRNTGDSGDREVTPEMFGHYCAMQAMGHGVGLYDAFGSEVYKQIKVPYCEFSSCSLEKDYFTADDEADPIAETPRKLSLADACARYTNRYTAEHVPVWTRKPCEGNGLFYAPQFASDVEWYNNTRFYGEVGHIGKRNDCYTSGQTWPFGNWLGEPYAIGVTPVKATPSDKGV